LTSELIDEKEEYEVKEILKKWCWKNELWYKIKWKIYSTEYDQWVLKHDISDVQDLQKQYNEQVKKKDRK